VEQFEDVGVGGDSDASAVEGLDGQFEADGVEVAIWHQLHDLVRENFVLKSKILFIRKVDISLKQLSILF
jgi:hypothetical protein